MDSFELGIVNGLEKFASMAGFERAMGKRSVSELKAMRDRVYKRARKTGRGRHYDVFNRLGDRARGAEASEAIAAMNKRVKVPKPPKPQKSKRRRDTYGDMPELPMSLRVLPYAALGLGAGGMALNYKMERDKMKGRRR
jgi:hypothetical protein